MRNKSNDEPMDKFKLPREQLSVVCAKCGKSGHNKMTWKGKKTADKEIPKGGNKVNLALLLWLILFHGN